MNLLDSIKDKEKEKIAPLAQRMKPQQLSQFIGQAEVLGEGSLLRKLIAEDRLRSMVFCGPSGVGKTSIAKVIANITAANFITLNAVTSGVKEIKAAVKTAEEELLYGRKTILFIDEIHRFNKLQQDALLPQVENGTLILIGATTENPYYSLNNALLSRLLVFKLRPLSNADMKLLLERALSEDSQLVSYNISFSQAALDFICEQSNGDARKALNILELASLSANNINTTIEVDTVKECVQRKDLNYDKNGDNHYDVISAFIKSIRGSDADAAIHYLARMLSAGEDINFIARRIVIAASEDIGNANPNALVVATAAMQAVQQIGMPEARIILAQAVCYLAASPKSNKAYLAINQALADIENCDIGEVPIHLRSNSYLTNDEKAQKNYRYPHDYPNAYVKQTYMPESLEGKQYYQPSQRGIEKRLDEYLKKIKQ